MELQEFQCKLLMGKFSPFKGAGRGRSRGLISLSAGTGKKGGGGGSGGGQSKGAQGLVDVDPAVVLPSWCCTGAMWRVAFRRAKQGFERGECYVMVVVAWERDGKGWVCACACAPIYEGRPQEVGRGALLPLPLYEQMNLLIGMWPTVPG